MRSLIPNMLTSLNLVLGMGSILSTLHGAYFLASALIVAAMVADGLDGRAARFFKVSSEFGRELDSLCDLVSFGAAPAILAYAFMLEGFGALGIFAAIMYATCGALRLARFNVNASAVKGHFMGLPIPAGGCLLATYIMLDIKPEGYIFPVMVMMIGYLMVSTVRYPDFKGKGDPTRIIPLGISAVVAVFILWNRHDAILFVPFICYALFGILNTAFSLFSKR